MTDKIKRQYRISANRLRMATAAIVGICVTWNAQAAPTLVDAAAAERMVAASPERERYRTWLTCSDHVADLVIAQGGDKAKAHSMIGLGCGEEESRLTGALIAKYGYARGNAALAALKNAAAGRYAAAIARRDTPPRAPGFVERTADGWDVKRLDDGCVAVRFKRNGLNSGGSATALVRGIGVAKILLLLAGNNADIADKKSTQSFDTKGIVSGGGESFNVALTLSPKPSDDGITYEAMVRGTLIAQLSQGENLQVEVPTGLVSSPTWPTHYPLAGIATAWSAVERCSGQWP